jgi:hypothetical protein
MLLVARTAAAGQLTDVDADGLPDDWEQQFGLNPSSSAGADGAAGDPDADGATNLQELAAGTHPRGFFRRYFSEGAQSTFFSCYFAIVNPSPDNHANVLMRFFTRNGDGRSHYMRVGRETRGTVNASDVPGLADMEFSTLVESDETIGIERTMTWDVSGYGSHSESGIAGPALTWYFAEGATHSGFDLFYLVQNPNSVAAVVDIDYLLPAPAAPVTKRYHLAPNSRANIWVNQEGGLLGGSDISAVITSINGVPVVAERAMSITSHGGNFDAGHPD